MCTKYACSKPQSQRAQYENPQIAQLKTLGNSFGYYQCQKSSIVNWAKETSFLGAVCSYAIIGIIADNFGRRKPLVALLTIGFSGFLLVMFASSIEVVAIGMFMVGFGIQTCTGLVYSVLK